MPGYYEERIRAILEGPSPSDTPLSALADNGTGNRHGFQAYLDADTKLWLYRRAPDRFRSHYLTLLARSNPTLRCWRDTRPDYLQAADVQRLQDGRLPLWSEGSISPALEPTNLTVRVDAIAIYEMVSDNYGILPARYHVFPNTGWEGMLTHRLEYIASYRQKVSGVVRAIAGGYLTPKFQPRPLELENFAKKGGKFKI